MGHLQYLLKACHHILPQILMEMWHTNDICVM